MQNVLQLFSWFVTNNSVPLALFQIGKMKLLTRANALFTQK